LDPSGKLDIGVSALADLSEQHLEPTP